MRRRLFNFMAVVSLVMCIATLLLWARSHRVVDFVGWKHASWRDNVYRHTDVSLLSGEGGLGVGLSHYVDRSPSESTLAVLRKYDPVGQRVRRSTWPARPPSWAVIPNTQQYLGRKTLADTRTERLGFVWERSYGGFKYDAAARRAASSGTALAGFGQLIVGVPAWCVALAFGLLPAWRVAALWRIRRRRRAGLCPTCNYDLRATPDRCPECGAVPNVS